MSSATKQNLKTTLENLKPGFSAQPAADKFDVESGWLLMPEGQEDPVLAVVLLEENVTWAKEVAAGLFAERHIPEYWVISGEENLVEQFTDPRKNRHSKSDFWYYRRRNFFAEDLIENSVLEGVYAKNLLG